MALTILLGSAPLTTINRSMGPMVCTKLSDIVSTVKRRICPSLRTPSTFKLRGWLSRAEPALGRPACPLANCYRSCAATSIGTRHCGRSAWITTDLMGWLCGDGKLAVNQQQGTLLDKRRAELLVIDFIGPLRVAFPNFYCFHSQE